ncbi:MAG: hypothetical protein U5R06_02850 [candidate division KSB1 bacterium]|nr:hypothetical protein [candidate division KSB1 bacterium]
MSTQKKITVFLLVGILFMLTTSSNSRETDKSTIAFWPFDEQQGIYPSCVLSDLSDDDYPWFSVWAGKSETVNSEMPCYRSDKQSPIL